jgi:hypothetical protein
MIIMIIRLRFSCSPLAMAIDVEPYLVAEHVRMPPPCCT